MNSNSQTLANEYRENDFEGCPYCGKDIFEKLYVENEPSSAEEEYIHRACSDCKRGWTEIYTRSGVILDDGAYSND